MRSAFLAFLQPKRDCKGEREGESANKSPLEEDRLSLGGRERERESGRAGGEKGKKDVVRAGNTLSDIKSGRVGGRTAKVPVYFPLFLFPPFFSFLPSPFGRGGGGETLEPVTHGPLRMKVHTHTF